MAQPIKFWDRSKCLDWFRMRALTRKIEARPALLRELESCVEMAWANDPSKARSLRLWRHYLSVPPQEFSAQALADTPEAEELRESFPPAAVFTRQERAAFIADSHREDAIA